VILDDEIAQKRGFARPSLAVDGNVLAAGIGREAKALLVAPDIPHANV
jgi:hypothetical protein